MVPMYKPETAKKNEDTKKKKPQGFRNTNGLPNIGRM